MSISAPGFILSEVVYNPPRIVLPFSTPHCSRASLKGRHGDFWVWAHRWGEGAPSRCSAVILANFEHWTGPHTAPKPQRNRADSSAFNSFRGPSRKLQPALHCRVALLLTISRTGPSGERPLSWVPSLWPCFAGSLPPSAVSSIFNSKHSFMTKKSWISRMP